MSCLPAAGLAAEAAHQTSVRIVWGEGGGGGAFLEVRGDGSRGRGPGGMEAVAVLSPVSSLQLFNKPVADLMRGSCRGIIRQMLLPMWHEHSYYDATFVLMSKDNYLTLGDTMLAACAVRVLVRGFVLDQMPPIGAVHAVSAVCAAVSNTAVCPRS